MAMVGEPSRFAIEYALDGDYGGEWLFGRFCYWSDGQRIGDFDLGTSLRDVLFQIDPIVQSKNRRKSQRFKKLSAIDAFRILDAAIFGTVDLNNASAAENEQWALLNVVPPLDVFDCWKAFLIEDEISARFIFAGDPYLNVKEILLRPGEVDVVLGEVRDALNDLLDCEKGASAQES